MGEIVTFDKGGSGLIFNLDEDTASVIVLEENKDLREGDSVKSTGKILSIIASEELLGRVVNPFGKPLDGKPEIKKAKACL